MNKPDVRTQAERFLQALLGGPPTAELRAQVDWARFGLMQLMQATAGVDAAAREDLVTRGLDALAKVQPAPDVQERALLSLRSLVEILIGQSWRFIEGWANPLLAGLRAGPLPSTPPGLRRYLERLAEVARAATPVTIAPVDPEATKLMTLLFVDELYAGFLPGAAPQR
jgi:hypothetical protein